MYDFLSHIAYGDAPLAASQRGGWALEQSPGCARRTDELAAALRWIPISFVSRLEESDLTQ